MTSMLMHDVITLCYTFVTGFANTDRNVTLGQLHLLVQLIATLIHYPCTVVLMGLVDWSAFLELVLPTM